MCWLITIIHNSRLAAVSTSLTCHRECCTILTCKSVQLKMGSCHDWGVQTHIIRNAVTRLTVCIEASCAVRCITYITKACRGRGLRELHTLDSSVLLVSQVGASL